MQRGAVIANHKKGEVSLVTQCSEARPLQRRPCKLRPEWEKPNGSILDWQNAHQSKSPRVWGMFLCVTFSVGLFFRLLEFLHRSSHSLSHSLLNFSFCYTFPCWSWTWLCDLLLSMGQWQAETWKSILYIYTFTLGPLPSPQEHVCWHAKGWQTRGAGWVGSVRTTKGQTCDRVQLRLPQAPSWPTPDHRHTSEPCWA